MKALYPIKMLDGNIVYGYCLTDENFWVTTEVKSGHSVFAVLIPPEHINKLSRAINSHSTIVFVESKLTTKYVLKQLKNSPSIDIKCSTYKFLLKYTYTK